MELHFLRPGIDNSLGGQVDFKPSHPAFSVRFKASICKSTMNTDNAADNSMMYGAFARIQIRYEGQLERLAAVLAEALQLKSFNIDTDEDPPHQKFASAEALGWEAWLRTSFEHPPYNFSLWMETEIVAKLPDGMHDLSEWFAQFVTACCGVEASPERS